MIKSYNYILILMIMFQQLYADLASDDRIRFSSLSYEQKGKTIFGEISLNDGSSWVCEIPFLNDYKLDLWKEGDLITITPNKEKVLTEEELYWKAIPGFQMENRDVNSKIVVFPTDEMLSSCLKVKHIATDPGWLSTVYYIQLEDEAWWKVDGSLSCHWKPHQRVLIQKSHFGTTIINFDISCCSIKIGYSDSRVVGVSQIDSHLQNALEG